MPIYHFHSANGEHVLDRDGVDLKDIARARIEAVRFAGEALAHKPDHLWSTGHWQVDVTDQNNTLLFTVKIEALDVT